jgi:predicted SAM-dependent methyltransferase
VKLNLGCGDRHKEGFVNVDLAENWCHRPPDVSADISKQLPFEDNYAEEIHAYHVFEHFYRYEADEILTDWIRVLKPGGLLVLELPCLDKILNIFVYCRDHKQEVPDNLTMWGLYGDPNYFEPAMVHRWCYSIGELSGMMNDRGLEVESTKPQTHQPIRDMRLEGRKWR